MWRVWVSLYDGKHNSVGVSEVFEGQEWEEVDNFIVLTSYVSTKIGVARGSADNDRVTTITSTRIRRHRVVKIERL